MPQATELPQTSDSLKNNLPKLINFETIPHPQIFAVVCRGMRETGSPAAGYMRDTGSPAAGCMRETGSPAAGYMRDTGEGHWLSSCRIYEGYWLSSCRV